MTAAASGTMVWAWMSTVFTRLPLTTTSRRRPDPGDGVGEALVRLHPTKARAASAPAISSPDTGIFFLLKRSSKNVLRFGGDGVLDTPVGHKPDQRDQSIDRQRDPGADEGQRNRRDIKSRRDLALEIAAEGLGQHRLRAVFACDSFLQQIPGEPRHQQRH